MPREIPSGATGALRECTMCGERFRQKSSRHFKCPRCGTHFTKVTAGSGTEPLPLSAEG